METIKRIVFIIIFCLLIASCFSCSNNSNDKKEEKEKSVEPIDNPSNTDEPTDSIEPDKPVDPIEPEEPTDPVEPEEPNEPVTDDYVPIVRFSIISDIHTRTLGESDATTDEIIASNSRTTSFFTSSYSYAENSNYKNVDAFIVVGDYTDYGRTSQYDTFFNVVNNNLKSSSKLLACLGNHEFWDNGESSGTNTDMTKTYQRFKDYFGYDVDTVNVINGFYFIGFSMDINGGRGFSEAKALWLEEQIQEAIKADPTGLKPIFVFQHVPASKTMLGSSSTSGGDGLYQVGSIDEILKKYPQVVDFSGHSHCPASDPYSIYQEYFTAINTGTFAYGSYPIYTDSGLKMVIQKNEEGGYFSPVSDAYNEHTERESSIFTIVEVDANNVVRIQYYNADNDCFFGEPLYISSIGKVEEFSYNETRKFTSEAPTFSGNIEEVFVLAKAAKLSLPIATSKDFVRNYKIELYKGTKLVDTSYRLALENQVVENNQITVSFTNLEPNSNYNVLVYAYNAYGILSTPISYSFKTKEYEVKPDIFSLGYYSDGIAINKLTNEKLEIVGSPEIVHDRTFNDAIISIDGKSAYDWYGISNYYDVLSKGFSFEVIFKLDSIPSSGYYDIVSNQESGGFGFECKTDGKVWLLVSILDESNALYKRVSVDITAKKYYHLMGVYDGKYIYLYLNGNLVSSLEVNGSVWFPLKSSAQYLSIGADSAVDGLTSHFSLGNIYVANLYSWGLTANEVNNVYFQYKNNIE